MFNNEDRISRVFEGHHVFVTGATGFMGKVFLERLLRATEIAKVYILIRPKRGKASKERLVEILDNLLFNTLRQSRNYVEHIKKIKIVDGDCSMEELGMHAEIRKELSEKLTMIFHFAATTRFDEKLKSAINLNLRGTLEMIKLTRECKNINLFCHISTAYCHLHESNLLEISYPSNVNPHELMSIVDRLTESEAELIKNEYLNKFIPNTYVLTKSLAEAIVVEALETHKLPVMIVRPSIITPTLSDPQPGWVNDYNGLGGLLIGIGTGVLRSIHCNDKYHGDFIPVDVAIHGIMMCTWNYLALMNQEKYIFNFTTSNEIVMSWGQILSKGLVICIDKYPMNKAVWFPNLTLTKYRWLHKTRCLFYHWIPAVIIDSVLFCVRIKPFLWLVQKKISRGTKTIEIFANNQWTFDNSNVIQIRSKMNEFELMKYKVSSDGIDIEKYMEDCLLGGHRFLLKDGSKYEDFDSGRRTMRILFIVDRLLKLIVLGAILYGLLSIILSIFS
ncbi:unnamed protein product [Chironomus riparius]|uniref:Fatty acyl-CoA reductase n=1 Tax=Chironomus riparius TaxID=315576 RepID=A0A9N9RR76_9DIPT|nr:unnamed protein product [Chironomus riparius]